jgi:hypothetical protein
MPSFSMRPAKYFYDNPLPKYRDPKNVLIYRPHPVHFLSLTRAFYLAVSALELPAEEVAEPALQKRRHPAHEEEPDPPAGRPEAAARPLPHRPSVEAVVDHVLQVFAHADLLHQLVLVPVHAWNTATVESI